MDESASKIQPGSVCRVPYETAGFGGKLVRDWVNGAPSATQFIPLRTWQEVTEEIATRKYPRRHLAELLSRSAEFEPARRNARLLAEENTFAVVTGQQAGFLGGPLYTLHKALTAIKLARQYEREARGTKKFVPVFWVAGDDHDIAEIDHANFLNNEGKVVRVDAPIFDECRGCSARDVQLNGEEAGVTHLVGSLAPFLPSDFLESMFKGVEGIYFTHRFENAFVHILSKWLGPEGLVVVPSSWMRGLSRELLLANLDDYEINAEAIQDAGGAMKDEGYEPGFSDELRVAPHFFMADLSTDPPGNMRSAIHVEKHESVTKFIVKGPHDIVFTKDELREQIKQHTHWFSTSAALRPILQNLIFPCVATVLGPGEVSYWAQLREAHEHYGAVWPVIVPRATITLIDAQGEKAVRKLGLENEPAAIYVGKDELRARAIAPSIAPQANAKKNEALEKVDELLKELGQSVMGIGPMLAKARGKIAYQLARVITKTAALKDRRNEALAARAEYLYALVHPKGAPQERVLCAAQFMAQYPDLPQRLLAAIEPDAREHLVVVL